MSEYIEIAIGVLKHKDMFCLSQRKKSQSFADKWEFPGGKVEVDETILEALIREFQEELGITTFDWQPLTIIPWDYESVSVRLNVFITDRFDGTPSGKEGQQVKWFTLEELLELDFPEANEGILKLLK